MQGQRCAVEDISLLSYKQLQQAIGENEKGDEKGEKNISLLHTFVAHGQAFCKIKSFEMNERARPYSFVEHIPTKNCRVRTKQGNKVI